MGLLGFLAKKEFSLRDELLKSGFIVSEYDENVLIRGNGVSVKFYATDSGLSMINVVDTQKPKTRWQHFRFRCDFIKNMDDFLFLMQGATVRGF